MRCVSKLSESDRPRRRRKVRQGRGFTLIELMVAIAIIALLIGLLIPAIKSVRNAAKDADTQALFQTLTQGNEQFRANQQIGGSYVPSTTDSTANQQDYTGIFGFMANPFESISGFSSAIFANGANLLVYGLAGADGLGTPGFVDIERTERTWCEDQHDREAAGNTPAGAYALDRTGGTLEPLHPRHGPFVSDKAFDRIDTIQQLIEDGVIVVGYNDVTDAHRANKVFTDAWGQPVLYYRARRAASIMVTNPTGSTPTPGVYDQRDNVVYTGGNVAGVPPDGLDFGSGATHRLNVSAYPVADPNVDNLDAATYNGGVPTFEQFIWNRDIPQRNVPVNKESFLLISAGPDALYGTADDITNWARD